jgi:hypothetical protein
MENALFSFWEECLQKEVVEVYGKLHNKEHNNMYIRQT